MVTAIISGVFLCLIGTENLWFMISVCIFITSVFFYFFNYLAAAHKYFYCNEYINLTYLRIPYKKIKYSDYRYIFISNASYDMGYGYGTFTVQRPMQYTMTCYANGEKVTYPFISLHTDKFPIEKIKKGMTSRDLYLMKNEEVLCLGICWFDSFSELLLRTNTNVYILEDVYLRFKQYFDMAIMQETQYPKRFYIVSERTVLYHEYRKQSWDG